MPPSGGTARLVVYNAAGRAVRTLVEGALPGGPSTFLWDGRADTGLRAAPGLYFARLERAGTLLPGASVTVRIGSERRLVVVAPRDAIAEGGYALVAEGERTALRTVVLGSDLGDGWVEVVSGLRPGEKLVRPKQ